MSNPISNQGASPKLKMIGPHGRVLPVVIRFSFLLFFSSPENKPDGRSAETESFAELVDKIPFVRKVNPLGLIGEDYESRRFYGHLRGIVELDPSPGCKRGMMGIYRLLEDIVEIGGRDPLGALLHQQIDFRYYLPGPLAALRGDEHDRGKGKILELHPYTLGEFAGGRIVLGNGIPLVDDKEAGAPRLIGISGDLGILLRDPLFGVYHDQNHIRPLDAPERIHDAVGLDLERDLPFPSDPGSIDELIAFLVAGEKRIDGVPRSPGHGVGDRPLESQQAIDQ